MLEWQRPENLHDEYLPPLVGQGVLTAEQFWAWAIHNGALRKDSPKLMKHAQRMLARAKEGATSGPSV